MKRLITVVSLLTLSLVIAGCGPARVTGAADSAGKREPATQAQTRAATTASRTTKSSLAATTADRTAIEAASADRQVIDDIRKTLDDLGSLIGSLDDVDEKSLVVPEN